MFVVGFTDLSSFVADTPIFGVRRETEEHEPFGHGEIGGDRGGGRLGTRHEIKRSGD